MSVNRKHHFIQGRHSRRNGAIDRYLFKTVKECERFNGCAMQWFNWKVLPKGPYSIISTKERDEWMD